MKILFYLFCVYLVIINIVAFKVYEEEGERPSRRTTALGMLLLPFLGGAVGAILANYIFNVEFRELRCWLSKFLGYLPPIVFICQLILIVVGLGFDNTILFIWDRTYDLLGTVGHIFIIVNCISFVLVVIRKSSYYIAPIGNYLISDFILVPILVLGGATGGVFAKVLFNFKEDWSCNSTMEIQNFLYNTGMFIVSVIHIALLVYLAIRPV